uniref:Secreted protein n=1 Tax=Anguilla anguilla TaxID=7936 RepID=A0A0E9X7J4_ANGAN
MKSASSSFWISRLLATPILLKAWLRLLSLASPSSLCLSPRLKCVIARTEDVCHLFRRAVDSLLEDTCKEKKNPQLIL